MFLIYLDLDELREVFRGRWLWSAKRKALARFRREDHFGDPKESLRQSVETLLTERGHTVPGGPIRLLTHLRYFGYVFNPVSFFFCYDTEGQLRKIVAEVNNTPWGERHCYVIDAEQLGKRDEASMLPKVFHVSPFMQMDQKYRWLLKSPGKRLTMHMENWQDGGCLFDVTMQLERREITGPRLAWQLVRFPLMTAQVIGAIYWEALRLWWKGVPYVPHPSARPEELDVGTSSTPLQPASAVVR